MSIEMTGMKNGNISWGWFKAKIGGGLIQLQINAAVGFVIMVSVVISVGLMYKVNQFVLHKKDSNKEI